MVKAIPIEMFRKAIEELGTEGKIIVSLKEVMRKSGYKGGGGARNYPRVMMDRICREGLTNKIVDTGRTFYIINRSYKLRLPFFEEPTNPQDAQVFLDKFFAEISEIVSDKVGSNSFSLKVNDGHLHAIIKKRVIL